jgi:hypothetical protein
MQGVECGKVIEVVKNDAPGGKAPFCIVLWSKG